MLFALLYPRFTAADRAAVDAMRAAHDPHRARLVDPHITLVFGVAEASPAPLLALAEQLAAETSRFAVTFDGFHVEADPRDRTRKVLLDAVEGRESVAALHEAFYEARPAAERLPFTAHMTVATTMTDAAERAAISAAEALPRPIRGTVEAIAIERLADGRLTRLGAFPLAD
ncbi:2'-5' RNA ligase family protein [Acuticoccus sp. M5D2P5]|uniref:2'-5' RNA ligase family protein n=1 Tax=Acuticoccus kalidii TaxID=2910977 RepID=UPI001F48B758|nr:2'-5' RNA ligase family protein [Acuticoccus kalidii]